MVGRCSEGDDDEDGWVVDVVVEGSWEEGRVEVQVEAEVARELGGGRLGLENRWSEEEWAVGDQFDDKVEIG